MRSFSLILLLEIALRMHLLRCKDYWCGPERLHLGCYSICLGKLARGLMLKLNYIRLCHGNQSFGITWCMHLKLGQVIEPEKNKKRSQSAESETTYSFRIFVSFVFFALTVLSRARWNWFDIILAGTGVTDVCTQLVSCSEACTRAAPCARRVHP